MLRISLAKEVLSRRWYFHRAKLSKRDSALANRQWGLTSLNYSLVQKAPSELSRKVGGVCRYACGRIIHPCSFVLFGRCPATATLRLAPVLPTTVAVAQFPDIRHATDAVCDILNRGVALRESQRSSKVPTTEPSMPVLHRMRRDHR